MSRKPQIVHGVKFFETFEEKMVKRSSDTAICVAHTSAERILGKGEKKKNSEVAK